MKYTIFPTHSYSLPAITNFKYLWNYQNINSFTTYDLKNYKDQDVGEMRKELAPSCWDLRCCTLKSAGRHPPGWLELLRLSPMIRISSEVGFGFLTKAFSRATRTVFSIEVRFFLLFPSSSAMGWEFCRLAEGVIVPSASHSHFSSSGFSLHMFLKDKFKASNLDIVVWEKSLPYIFPMANPTSPWV